MKCTNDSHAKLKAADPLRVAAAPYQGTQSDGAANFLALHACPEGCGSTLALDTRVILMWTAVREAGVMGAAGDLEGCCSELMRAADHAKSILSSLEWEAHELREDARRAASGYPVAKTMEDFDALADAALATVVRS